MRTALLNVSSTVITYNLDYSLPKFVLDTLSLGPKSAVLDHVNPKNILAELDLFHKFCKDGSVNDNIFTDINIKTKLLLISKSTKSRNHHGILPTDSDLIMNFHALAPLKRKRSVVTGFVHRIFWACSTWEHFHGGLERPKRGLCNNQYPTNFYEPLIHSTIEKLHLPHRTNEAEIEEVEEVLKHVLFLQYRGKVTEDYVWALDKLNAACKLILTLRKLKTVLHSLKVPVEKSLQSRIVYELMCPSCQACYVGQTDRHVLKRFKEHCQPSQPFTKHIILCGASPVFTDKKYGNILHTTTRNIPYLEALEALWNREITLSGETLLGESDEFFKSAENFAQRI